MKLNEKYPSPEGKRIIFTPQSADIFMISVFKQKVNKLTFLEQDGQRSLRGNEGCVVKS